MSNKEPRSLHWHPRDPAAWLARTARLSPDAYTAYDRLRCQAWLAPTRGEPACSLPDDDEDLANMSGLGRDWRRVSARVRAMFTADGGRLIVEDLLKTWYEQQNAYEKRASAGGKGGKAKALKKPGSSNATAKRKQSELELEEMVESPYRDSTSLSADGAHALAGARADGGTDAAAPDLRAEYYEWLVGAVDAWCAANRDASRELELAAMRKHDMPFEIRRSIQADTAPPERVAMVRRHIIDDVREAAALPDEATWIATRGAAA